MRDGSRVYISKSDRSIYNKFKYDDNPFKGRKNREIFIIAVALGYKLGTRTKLEKPDEQYDHVENFGEEINTIIKAIAVEEEGIEVLDDKVEVYKIADEYAATGIKYLEGLVFSHEFDFTKKLENILVDEYDRQKMGE